MDVLELSKRLQKAGYNVPQTTNIDNLRPALKQMNESHGWTVKGSESALLQQGIDFLANFSTNPTEKQNAMAMESLEKNNITVAVRESSTPASQSNQNEINNISQAVNQDGYYQSVQAVQPVISSPDTGYFPNQSTIANQVTGGLGNMDIENILGAVFGIVLIGGVFSLFRR